LKHFKSLFVGLVLIAFAGPVLAADSAGSITITSPANGAMLSSGNGNKLDFNVHFSPNGNHVHIYIDDQKPMVFRDAGHCPCSADLPNLSSGKHTIVIKEATSSHALTGVQGTTVVTVK